MSLGRKILIGLLAIITVITCVFTYKITMEAREMWALGDIENLYNTPCDVNEVYYETNEALVTTIRGAEIKVELGPFSKVNIGDSISVVCDESNNPITSFDKYYQTIQLSLLSLFITGMLFVITTISLVVSLLDKREMKYYIDEDINDEDFAEYSYIDETNDYEYKEYKVVS